MANIRMLIKPLTCYSDPSSHQTWNISTIIDWSQKQRSLSFDAEATTACQLVTPAKVGPFVSLRSRPHYTRGTTSNLWSLLGSINGISSLLKLSVYGVTVAVWSANSGHIILTLKLIHILFLVFQTTKSPITQRLLSKRSPRNGPILKVFNGHSILPTIHRHPVLSSIQTVSSKFNSEQSTTPCPSSLHTP